MGIRRALVAVGVVIAVLVVVLVRKSSDQPSVAVTHDKIPVEPTAAPTPPPELPAPTTPVQLQPQPQPQPVPLAGSATPPPLDGKHSEAAPPQKPFTPAEVIAKREADLKLLDDTKARLQQQLAAARAANDTATAHDLEIRIGRLTDVRTKRGQELDHLRAGGSASP
jgi:outer membrane biosynthesis protein TonB